MGEGGEKLNVVDKAMAVELIKSDARQSKKILDYVKSTPEQVSDPGLERKDYGKGCIGIKVPNPITSNLSEVELSNYYPNTPVARAVKHFGLKTDSCLTFARRTPQTEKSTVTGSQRESWVYDESGELHKLITVRQEDPRPEAFPNSDYGGVGSKLVEDDVDPGDFELIGMVLMEISSKLRLDRSGS